MILETAYPWAANGNDNYNNSFGNQPPVSGFAFSVRGIGVIYWEPAWITSAMKDLWGTGSSWENATFFDFNGNAIQGINYMKFAYTWR